MRILQGPIVSASLAAAGLVACADRDRDRSPQAADTSATADTTDTAESAGDAATGADSASSGPLGDCSESTLEACDYPSRALTATIRDDLRITDETTGRELNLLARIPAGPGPFPVVIWSHGGSFNDNGHRLSVEWGEAFAAEGYVTIHIGHAAPTTETGPAVCATVSIPAAECVAGDDEDATGLLALFKTSDVAAVLEQLPRLSQASVAAGGPALDLARVAVAGWSGGARAPAVVADTVIDTTASGERLARFDDRVKAAILMSPAGPGFGGLFDDGSENSWSTVETPVFWATGANDVKPNKTDLTGPVRRHGFPLLPADGHHWLLYSHLEVGIGGHDTYNLTDRASPDPRLSRLSRAIRSGAIAFLDAQLRDDAAAAAWLASDNADILAGDVDWEHR